MVIRAKVTKHPVKTLTNNFIQLTPVAVGYSVLTTYQTKCFVGTTYHAGVVRSRIAKSAMVLGAQREGNFPFPVVLISFQCTQLILSSTTAAA